jgi:hypothetical protein
MGLASFQLRLHRVSQNSLRPTLPTSHHPHHPTRRYQVIQTVCSRFSSCAIHLFSSSLTTETLCISFKHNIIYIIIIIIIIILLELAWAGLKTLNAAPLTGPSY